MVTYKNVIEFFQNRFLSITGHTPPLSLPPQLDLFDNTPESGARAQGNKSVFRCLNFCCYVFLVEKEVDRNSQVFDDDEEDDNFELAIDSEEENDSLENDSPNVLSLPPTKTFRKRAPKSKKKIPIAKRLRFTVDDDDEKDENQQVDLQQLLNHIKKVNTNVFKLQKQQEQTMVFLERQEKFLNLLSTNQKKLAKSLTRRKVRATTSYIFSEFQKQFLF